MRTLFLMTALLAGASSALAQRSDLAVEQLPGRSPGRAVPQVSAEGASMHAPAASDQAPAQPGQLSSPRAGREPVLRQISPRAAGAAPTPQLADRNVNPRINALPPGLVDACARAAEGKGDPPKGVDCTTVIEAEPPPRPISAEEALLMTDEEKAAQRTASEQQSRGRAPDAGEVARRLSSGDVSNSPVAQAVAAQAAADTLANSQPSGNGQPVIVPGGGSVVVPGRN